MSNPAICITGMHRSGTSMVARLFNLCGLYLGREEDLVNPMPDNPEGYWENGRFVQIDDAVLGAFGGGWDMPPAWLDGWERDPRLDRTRGNAANLLKEFDGCGAWGWKDPRASLTLPFWLSLLPDLRVLICVRNPLEVARSLYRRGYNTSVYSFYLWQTYYERLLRAAPERTLVTHLESYFINPEAELQRVFAWAGMKVRSEQIAEASTHVSSDLWHNRLSEEELAREGASRELLALYARLCEQAGPVFARGAADALRPERPASPPPRDNARFWPELVARQQQELDALHQEHARLQAAFQDLERWAHRLEAIAAEQERTLARLRKFEFLRPLARWLMRPPGK